MRKISLFLLVAAAVFVSSCGLGSTPIAKIKQNPRDYEGKVVHVKGTVTSSMNLLVVKYFVLKDDTGEITVVTERILPKEGDKAEASGTVKEAFTIGFKQELVIVEEAKGVK